MRIFISIDMPKEIQKKIIKIQNSLPDFFGKKTEPENLHLTLKFLGEINEEKLEKVKQKLKEIKFNKFQAEIDNIGIFSESFVRIVWLHLSKCEKLQKEIDEKLKNIFEPEKRFMSHLTIARIKKCDRKKFLEKLKKIKISKTKFDIGNFKLKKSILTEKGPIYENLGEYDLE
jgi:RNA 2',3'-cyclic 3'-phosphodiesterase